MNPPFYLIQIGRIELVILTATQLSTTIGFVEGGMTIIILVFTPAYPGGSLNKTNFTNF
jgi:hypothetical protein